jgi:hypothetical protein
MRRIASGEDDAPRPDLLGYSREARQLHQVQTELALLHRVHQPAWPLPAEPETVGERVQKRKEQAQVEDLMADIFKANPSVLGTPKP